MLSFRFHESLQRGSPDFPLEYYLLDQGIYQLEVLNNLNLLPATGSFISIAYPHWEKATGSPVRAIAYIAQE